MYAVVLISNSEAHTRFVWLHSHAYLYGSMFAVGYEGSVLLLPELSNRYEEAKAKGMDNYDRELEETIERLIVECERKIQRALKRLEEEDAKAAIAISITEVTQSKEVLEFSKQIKEKMKEIDTFDFDGNTEGKIRATEEVDKLKEQRAEEQIFLGPLSNFTTLELSGLSI